MSKDPAFLLYSGDFLIGTSLMSEMEVGQYIRVLCHMHQQGHLTKEEVLTICPQISDKVLQKFSKDRAQKMFNERLDSEINKRLLHSQKQRDNARKRWDKSGMQSGNAMALPLDNGNDNGNKGDLGVQGKKGNEVPQEFIEFHDLYPGQDGILTSYGKKYCLTEFKAFKASHKDWQAVLPLLVPAIKNEIAYWTQQNQNGKDFKMKRINKWLFERCWEEHKNHEPVAVEPIKISTKENSW